MTDFLFGAPSQADIAWDVETFPNVFTFVAKTVDMQSVWRFILSPWRQELHLLRQFIYTLARHECRLVGFNSIGFDYPVLHHIMTDAYATVDSIYQKAMRIITGDDRFGHTVWENEWILPQLDLYKMHHFDNKAKATGLKVLEFNMRRDVEDLPFDPGTHLTADQVPVLLKYNENDVDATIDFYHRSQSELAMREALTKRFNINMVNMSNTKIGETILVTEMEQRGIQCYTTAGGRRVKRQTIRDQIHLRDAILPYIKFERPEFNEVLEFLREKSITETKGVFKGLTADVEGLKYAFGTGGIHASVNDSIVRSTDTHILVDVDVASYYPNLAIKNRYYPAHLGEAYCDAYEGVYHTRRTFPKKTPENNAYKEALNASYGNSNNEYSVLFDPLYTMTTTLGGQLSLCMLIEQLIKVPGLRIIQANTDGITYLCPRGYLDHCRSVCRWWEQVTQLELEEVLYSAMYIRDVNSYIAVDLDGKVKRIGAYAHETALQNPGTRELPWHKDWSQRVVPMAAEAALVRGEDIEEFITHHQDVYDFMLRTKVPRSSILEWGGDRVPNTVRYYISTDGDFLEKVMPPAGPLGEFKRANGVSEFQYQKVMAEIGPGVWDERIHTKSKTAYEERRTRLHDPFTVRICNKMEGHAFNDINYDYYIREAKKLVDPLRELVL